MNKKTLLLLLTILIVGLIVLVSAQRVIVKNVIKFDNSFQAINGVENINFNTDDVLLATSPETVVTLPNIFKENLDASSTALIDATNNVMYLTPSILITPNGEITPLPPQSVVSNNGKQYSVRDTDITFVEGVIKTTSFYSFYSPNIKVDKDEFKDVLFLTSSERGDSFIIYDKDQQLQKLNTDTQVEMDKFTFAIGGEILEGEIEMDLTFFGEEEISNLQIEEEFAKEAESNDGSQDGEIGDQASGGGGGSSGGTTPSGANTSSLRAFITAFFKSKNVSHIPNIEVVIVEKTEYVDAQIRIDDTSNNLVNATLNILNLDDSIVSVHAINPSEVNQKIKVDELVADTEYKYYVTMSYLNQYYEMVQYSSSKLKFSTKALDVNIELSEAAEDFIEIYVYSDLGEKIEYGEVVIYDDKTNEIHREPIDPDALASNQATILFSQLKPDNEYTFTVENLSYKDEVHYIEEEQLFTTQKQTPIIYDATVSTNSVKGEFSITSSNIFDPNNSVDKIRYEAYEIGNLQVPVATVQKTYYVSDRSATFGVDNTALRRNQDYVFKVTIIGNNNSNNFEVSTAFTSTVKIAGKRAPSAKLVIDYTTGTSFGGSIMFVDIENTIKTVSKLNLYENGHLIESKIINDHGNKYIFEFENLNLNTVYNLELEMTFDLEDGGGAYIDFPMESRVVITKKTNFSLFNTRFNLYDWRKL